MTTSGEQAVLLASQRRNYVIPQARQRMTQGLEPDYEGASPS